MNNLHGPILLFSGRFRCANSKRLADAYHQSGRAHIIESVLVEALRLGKIGVHIAGRPIQANELLI
ncbi:hypothetical protein D3C86_2099950 [compost metagenome]